MREVSLGLRDAVKATLRRLIQSIREIENASGEEPIAVADSYGADTPATPTRTINVTSPTAANLAAVLATLVADLQRRGINKST